MSKCDQTQPNVCSDAAETFRRVIKAADLRRRRRQTAFTRPDSHLTLLLYKRLASAALTFNMLTRLKNLHVSVMMTKMMKIRAMVAVRLTQKLDVIMTVMMIQ